MSSSANSSNSIEYEEISSIPEETLVSSPSSQQRPKLFPNNSYLYQLPEGLHRYYQPLPLLLQAATVLISSWVAAVATWKRLVWWQPLSVMRSIAKNGGYASYSSSTILLQVISFVVKTVFYTLLCQCVLQEFVAPPSRISIKSLRQKYWLPSKLSKYRTIVLPSTDHTENGNDSTLGVHVLEYQNAEWSDKEANEISKNAKSRFRPHFDAVYLQHGFGASSLSWLPAMPSLVHRLGARVGTGHDAVGFGFTGRPSENKWYTSKQSAYIASQVLQQIEEEHEESHGGESISSDALQNIALFGHSMGSLAMLRLATMLPSETRKLVILAAPALGFNNRKSLKTVASSSSGTTRIDKTIIRSAQNAIQSYVILPPTVYVLRRIVGTKGVWKFGLKGAWGDPNKVTENDVLRFSWPAIVKGWERGILKFAAAQQFPQDDELDDDPTLMRRVLELPNTHVAIVVGSKDRIVPPSHIRKFMTRVDLEGKVPIIELEGLGHDTFEENTETFCETVDTLVKQLTTGSSS